MRKINAIADLYIIGRGESSISPKLPYSRINLIKVKLAYTTSRSHYGPLLLGKVQIYEYKAALMHAKTIVIDGVWSTIGSSNFDNRSFALNQEVNLTVYDTGIAHRLEPVFREDLEIHSR